jgi:hypothetical protein
MTTLKKLAAIGIIVPSILAIALPSTSIADAKPNPTMKGSLPKGKPFQYLNSRIDYLQAQINLLIGRVDSLDAWQIKAEKVLLKLEQDTAKNAAEIALLTSEIENIKTILQTKQDIINQDCPANQVVAGVTQSPAGLVCRQDIGANGLAKFSVENIQNVAATSSQDVAATCPSGTAPMGGSYNAAPSLTVVSSGIVDNGYSVNVANTTAGVLPVTVTATCLGIAN